jgi:hypothetical protein
LFLLKVVTEPHVFDYWSEGLDSLVQSVFLETS